MRRRFAFLHVPKTAGSSATAAIRQAIDAVEPPLDVCPWGLDRTLFGAHDGIEQLAPQRGVFTGDPAELAPYDAILGHFALSSLVEGRTPADVASLFREPRSRLLSLYTFWRSWPEERHAEWDPYDASRVAVAREWSDFLADASIASQTDNAAARLLLHPHPLIPVDGFIRDADVEEVTGAALAALDSLGHADVIERGDGCWLALGAWLGSPLVVGHRNTTSSDQHVELGGRSDPEGAEAAARLLGRTRIDAAVWHRAVLRSGALSADQADRLAEEVAAARYTTVVGRTSSDRVAERTGAKQRTGVRGRGAAAWQRVSRRRADR